MEKAIDKITNLINGKVYIGQSIHPERRWIEHKQRARHGKEKSAIHLAIEKYDEENFSFEILKWSENYNKEEIDMIKKYNSLIPNGYNITEGGENCCVLRGEDNPRNTVPNNIISLIIQDLKNNKLTDRAIAKKYNLTDKIIADINHGYSHKQENENYPIRIKRGSQKLTQEQVREIKKYLETSLISHKELADKYGVSKGTIYHINTGRTFKEERNYPIRKEHKIN